MLGTGELGAAALGQDDDSVSPAPVYSAASEFAWTLSATIELKLDDDEVDFVWE